MLTNSLFRLSVAGTLRVGDLVVHRMGFGAMRVTGRDVWGEPPDRDATKRLLARVLELGITTSSTPPTATVPRKHLM